MNKHLVLLSVPIIRVGRVLLGDSVLDAIRDKEKFDVVIISPFAADLNIQNEFAGKGTHFFKWRDSLKNSRLEKILSTIITIQRTHGYWLRQRNKGMGMAYYHRNAVYVEQDDGSTKKLSLTKVFLYRLIALTGYFQFSWRFMDMLRGFLFRSTSELDTLIKGYEKITLIQSCSWGEQDMYLAWYARKKKIRTMLIPYTTDQIYCNGFLLSNYDAVCVQGEFEKKCATMFHAIPQSRQKGIGSGWFRNIDQILEDIGEDKNFHSAGMKYILFAGHSSRYFSRESEYRALAFLEKAIQQGLFGKAKIIYRPVCFTQQEAQKIQEDWGHYQNIEIQLPQLAIIGLNDQPADNIRKEWHDYLIQLKKVDVLVMSFVSSLVMDIGYLGKPSFILFDDPSGKLLQKNSHLMLDSSGKIPALEKFSITYKIEDLVPQIQQALASPPDLVKLKHNITHAWDYPDVNFKEELIGLIDY